MPGPEGIIVRVLDEKKLQGSAQKHAHITAPTGEWLCGSGGFVNSRPRVRVDGRMQAVRVTATGSVVQP